MSALTPRQKRIQKDSRAKNLLNGVEPRATDQGDDDEVWQWIYEGGSAQDSEEEVPMPTTPSKKRKRKSVNAAAKEKPIVGARKAGFEVRVGDTVMVRNENGADWAAIVTRFFEDEDEEENSAEMIWFIDQSEVTKKGKRTDFMAHELYITPGKDSNSLDSINGLATILSEKAFISKHPKGIPRKHKDFGNTFMCRRGVNLKTNIYTDEMKWEDVKHSTAGEVALLVDRLELSTATMRKRKFENIVKKDDNFTGGFIEEEEEEDSEVEMHGTPRKKRKTTSVATTPRKPKTPSKLLTPRHKKIIIKKPLEFTPLGTRVLDPDHVYASPFQTARSRLHVSSVPTSLPCREEEFTSVYSHLEAAIYEGTGACIYISGTPGTGKTATVREVVAQLNASVQAEELDDFIFVEINGMKVTDPHQSYSLLWEALKGDRVSPSHALDLLEREFNHPSPRRVPCVVLMDELDQLVTKNQSVMYNFFNWPGLKHSRLIVLAVANTMDLPERTLSNKISSRLGLTRITFPGYNFQQLSQIIQSRLSGVPGNIVTADAITFASKKVASVSGDARRALDICRRAVELAEADSLIAFPLTPSKSGRDQTAGTSHKGIVTIQTIKRAINEATTSPLQQYLRTLPLASKILLSALIARTRRTGIAESILGEVIDEAKRMAKMDTVGNMTEFLLKTDAVKKVVHSNHWTASNKERSRLAPRLLAMGTSAVELMEAGIIGLEMVGVGGAGGKARAERMGKVRLCVGEEDVKLAFREDPEVRGLGFQ